MTTELSFSREGQIGLITLNRPAALNALNLAMIKSLQQQLSLWADDRSIHAVIIQGSGERAFCAGGDIRSLYDNAQLPLIEKLQFFWHEYRLNHYISNYKKPYIALMNGITMGGGVGISLHGSHPIASDRFIFAMPETGIGFFPDIGASYLLARCPGMTGIYLGLTGNRIGATDALYLGLVKGIIDSHQFPAVINKLINTDLSEDAHQRVTHCLNEFALFSEQARMESDQQAIDQCFSGSNIEEIFALLKARGDDWAINTLDTLEHKAPLSLKVTLLQIQKAQSLSMAECIKMDYCLVSHFMCDKDFFEGVRALLVDKDKHPHWQPPTLEQVSDEKLMSYFELDFAELELID